MPDSESIKPGANAPTMISPLDPFKKYINNGFTVPDSTMITNTITEREDVNGITE